MKGNGKGTPATHPHFQVLHVEVLSVKFALDGDFSSETIVLIAWVMQFK